MRSLIRAFASRLIISVKLGTENRVLDQCRQDGWNQDRRDLHLKDANVDIKVSKGAKIRSRYNQVPHLTQETNGKVTTHSWTPQTRAKRSALSQQVTTRHI